MINNQFPLIFDGHNDVLLRLYKTGGKYACREFLDGDGEGHLDFPRIRKGGFGGGFFAIHVPSSFSLNEFPAQKNQYDIALSDEISFSDALPIAIGEAALLTRIERASGGKVKICRNGSDIRECFGSDILTVVMHMEGAEAVGEDFSGLEILYKSGLRSIGPVWSRPTRFGHGVPFRFPSSPDTGPGLTDQGKELVHLCNQFRMVIDLSHLNEAGFWDVAKITDSPLVATHSNVHALCPHSRNLTDKQLAAIKDSRGMVGVNFASSLVRADGNLRKSAGIEEILHHFDYLIEHLGVEGVAIGSDFDGAAIPDEIGDVTGLIMLRKEMRHHGYDEETMVKLCHMNWISLLERVLGS